MSTVTPGYDELSTWPTNSFLMMATSPFVVSFVLFTDHVTFGTFAGTRP